MITEASIAPTLSVSIVLHNSSLEHLRVTLQSLVACIAELEDVLSAPVSLTLLDNDSTADYRQEVADLVAQFQAQDSSAWSLHFHLSSHNAGFGAGHNQALQDSSDRYLLILNPDVELAPAALREALFFLNSQSDVVAVNPFCERGDGSPEYLCKRYPTIFDLVLRGLPFSALRERFAVRLAHYEYGERDADVPAEVELLSGACLLCRQSAFTAVGRFDERFFMYFEDFDLSLRLASQGRLMYLPTMRIVHHGGFAARKGLRHIIWFARSAARFFSVHGWRLH
ncbi:glycosyltransferase [Congregibacter variabilis]|uniref:Glycosyltransferase n=1 Tax=Congregibacter variabilis TaxID=3081200 RepID=A0ABZ0I212_9GAMM|nr:glycosyltransferase [Congregibacter sp. IMCC43200]